MMSKNRRDFIKKIGLVGAVVASNSGSVFSEPKRSVSVIKRTSSLSPSQDLNIALIGAGGMGTEDALTALRHDGITLVAVCDLYQGRLKQAKERWGETIFATNDYRAILKRSNIDVVIVATPDHWHKQICIDALNAGKHVYCEKPMIHAVFEGHELITAWKKSKKVMIVGSQGMSSLGNEKAKELLAAGAIGDLNYAEGFWARNSPIGAWQYAIPKDASTKTVDWKRYISNTTKRDFDALRFFRWRNYRDYGTGMSGDLFVHLFSSLHFITNSLGPTQISAMGGLRYWKDGREVPDVLLGMFQYPDSKQHPGFNLSLRCNFVDGTSGTTYLKIVGSRGSMDVKWREVVLRRNEVSSDDPFEKAKQQELGIKAPDRKKIVPAGEIVYKAQDGYKGAHYDHFRNFFHAIRSGGQVDENPEFAFRAAAPALLCNDSYFDKKYVNWDPVNMNIK